MTEGFEPLWPHAKRRKSPQEAFEEAVAVGRMGQIIDRTARLHKHAPGDLAPGLDALADMLSDSAFLKWEAAGYGVCPHLKVRPVQPTFIFVYRPETAMCFPCAAKQDKAMRGTPEDTTCDACGLQDPVMNFYPLGTIRGFITFQGGICEKCHDRVTA